MNQSDASAPGAPKTHTLPDGAFDGRLGTSVVLVFLAVFVWLASLHVLGVGSPWAVLVVEAVDHDDETVEGQMYWVTAGPPSADASSAARREVEPLPEFPAHVWRAPFRGTYADPEFWVGDDFERVRKGDVIEVATATSNSLTDIREANDRARRIVDTLFALVIGLGIANALVGLRRRYQTRRGIP